MLWQATFSPWAANCPPLIYTVWIYQGSSQVWRVQKLKQTLLRTVSGPYHLYCTIALLFQSRLLLCWSDVDLIDVHVRRWLQHKHDSTGDVVCLQTLHAWVKFLYLLFASTRSAKYAQFAIVAFGNKTKVQNRNSQQWQARCMFVKHDVSCYQLEFWRTFVKIHAQR